MIIVFKEVMTMRILINLICFVAGAFMTLGVLYLLGYILGY